MKDFSLEDIAKAFFGFDDPQRTSIASTQIQELDSDAPIDGKEGVGPDHLVRARLQFLAAQTTSLHHQVQFADAKGALLITALGFIAARGGYEPSLSSFAGFFDLVFYLGLAGSFAAVLWAVAPSFPDRAARAMIARRERFSWPGVVGDGRSADDFAAFMRKSAPSQLVVSMARCNAALSVILQRKYLALRCGFISGGVAFSGLALALLLKA